MSQEKKTKTKKTHSQMGHRLATSYPMIYEVTRALMKSERKIGAPKLLTENPSMQSVKIRSCQL